MTDPAIDPPPSPLDEALRVARACAHSRRLDTASQAAIDALVALGRSQAAELHSLRARVAALESLRLIIDP